MSQHPHTLKDPTGLVENIFQSKVIGFFQMRLSPGVGVTAYIVVYKDVQQIWSGFFDSNYKYGCGILEKKIYIWILKLWF